MSNKPKHDSLVKQIMSDPVAAQEFFEYYLPKEFKEKVDLSKIQLESESYIDESLRKKYSDLVYSIKTKDNEKAFIYTLIESQSTVDYWIALRLLEYTILLCKRHKSKKNKLPLVYMLVIYNGKEVYNAPRNLWGLFEDPVLAKKWLADNYQLVDLQSMSDDEIVKKKHLGMFEYMLKHIHQRDMFKLWEDFFTKFKHQIVVDKERGYIYIKSFLWYTDAKLSEEQQPELERILTQYISSEEKNIIMRTIAQKYIEEGEARGKAELVHMMIANGVSIENISKMTKLSIVKINELLKIRA